MAKKKMEERDWSLLPSDVLQAVADKAISLADYIRFRAVCHPWRSASSPRPLHLPPQLPWLMPLHYTDPNDDSARPFYDLDASKIRMLHLPEIRGAKICGSSHGWLVLSKGQVLSLLNPITHATFPLPPVTALPATIPTGAPPAHYLVQPTDKFTVVKAMLTSSPLDPSCLVFVNAHWHWDLAFCKIGDERWTAIDFNNGLPRGIRFFDFAYSNGRLYTISGFGLVTVYDINKPSQLILSNFSFGFYSRYIVDGVSGDIFVISLEGVHVYSVYKLISNDEKPHRIRVWDIGSREFFLQPDVAIFFSSAYLQLPEWSTNCLFCHNLISNEIGHSIRLVRLDDGIVTDITGNLKTFHNSINWKQSIWLTPSLL